MARNMYGATSADFTLTSGGRVVPGATLTIWSARTGGTQITDLLDKDSVATTTVTSGADGSIVYYGPNNDKTVHWADSGVGSRIAVRPTDITGDPPVLSIGTVGTGTAAANLTGTSEAPVLNLTLPSAGANGVNTAAIQDSAVTSAKIADGTIVSTDVAAGTFATFGTVGNLLTASEAAGTASFYATNNAALAGSTVTAVIDNSTMNAGYRVLGVTEGATYTWIVDQSATGGGWANQPLISWRNSSDAQISAVTAPAGVSGAAQVRIVATAPAGAVAAYVYCVNGGSVSAGVSSVTIRALSFHKGAGGVVSPPGTPIVGGSHIATNGAVHLSGTGSPEGVVTAAPGSTWLQTDATTDVKGWLRWIKATGTGNTGWVAGPEADTGWRDISASLLNSWVVNAADGAFQIRRFGNVVMLRAYIRNGTLAANIYAAPSGFRPSKNHYFHCSDYFTGAAVGGGFWSSGGGNLERYNSNAAAYTVITTHTSDAWPSSLPGSPA